MMEFGFDPITFGIIGVFVGGLVIALAIAAYFVIKSATTQESESSTEPNPFTITD